MCAAAKDAANTGYSTPTEIKIDKQKPTASIVAPTAWQNFNATADVSCTDALSGCNDATKRLKIYTTKPNPYTCPTAYNSYPTEIPEGGYTITTQLWVCGAVKDEAGNDGVTNKPAEFNVSTSQPSVNLYYTPTVVNSSTLINFTVEATAPSGIQGITLTIDSIGTDCTSSSCSVQKPAEFAGKIHSYRATVLDKAGNLFTTIERNLTICDLESVSALPVDCGTNGCDQGNKVRITATYKGACPANTVISINAASGSCTQNINVTCSSSPCTADWAVQLPAACRGVLVNLSTKTAAMLDLVGVQADISPASGAFRFLPAICSDGTYVGYCSTTTTNMGKYCDNVDGSPAFVSGFDKGCSCTGIRAWISVPYEVAYFQGFENNTELPVMESLIGSTAISGVTNEASTGPSSLQSYLIQKTNTPGYTRATLSANVVAGENYTVSAMVKTNRQNFAKILNELESKSANHSGSNQWEQLSYTFKASSSIHNIVLQVSGAEGTAYFDEIYVKKHTLQCTGVCAGTQTPYGSCVTESAPLYCTQSGSRVSDCTRCGCPRSDIYNSTFKQCVTTGADAGKCREPVCSDGTIIANCSVVKPLYCDIATLPNLINKSSICGCPSGKSSFGEICKTCAELNISLPALSTQSYGIQQCVNTGGARLTTNHTIYTNCPAGYECDCSNNYIFNETAGCVEACRKNGICESWETTVACLDDCPEGITFTSASTTETESGLLFSGSTTFTMISDFRVCDPRFSVQDCRDSSSCNITNSCICKSTSSSGSGSCSVNCYDRSGQYYIYANGLGSLSSAKKKNPLKS